MTDEKQRRKMSFKFASLLLWTVLVFICGMYTVAKGPILIECVKTCYSDMSLKPEAGSALSDN